MRMLVESYKRLYKNGKISKEELRTRIDRKLITEEEYDYIISER